jgi:uroporphyrinogen-III synthase
MPAFLLTRPAEGSARFAEALRTRLGDVPVVIAPVLRIEGTGAEPDLSDDPILIFTSRSGVEHRGFGAHQGLTALCVGDATAQAAQEAGIDARSAGGDVEDLLRLIADERPARPLLHLRGTHSTGDLVPRLIDMGLTARETVVYDQLVQPLSEAAITLLAGDSPVVVPLFSPRSASALAAQYQGKAPLWLAAISPAAADATGDLPRVALRIAETPALPAMVEACCGLYDAAQSLEGGSRAQ